MEIKIYCYECGDELEIIEECTSIGDVIISVSPCKSCFETSENNKKLMDEY